MNTELPQIGIFDSGVGGLSVLRAIREQPGTQNLPIIYLADQAHVPYGIHTQDEIRQFSEANTRYLLGQGAFLIVVACNTATSAALHFLRETFPDTPFVGMEPAIKPAAEITKTDTIGVLATPVTFNGSRYASLVERFAHGVTLLHHTCPGLVEQIEAGELDSPTTRAILESALMPMLARDVDTIVLGCTHYPFVLPLIREIVGPDVTIIDPAPAVARQVNRLIEQYELISSQVQNTITYLTSGDASKLATLLPKLLGEKGDVKGINLSD